MVAAASKVQWQEWGAAAFAQAEREGKPVLLAISAVWCHWCHVMDRGTYGDEQIAAYINAHYVAIRVDNDQRPDINDRYNQGGWPTTAFLTAEGEILSGATYLPPEQMQQVLEQVYTYYSQNREQLREQVAALIAHQQEHLAQPGGKADALLSAEMIAQVLNDAGQRYDAQFGGWSGGGGTKFPHNETVALVLSQFWHSGEQHWAAVLRKTLDGMADQGMYDHVEGGFFRYSTDRQWRVPHFEKMGEDHAGLLHNYVAASLLLDPRYGTVALDAIRYLDSTLTDQQQGGFYGSQDADEEYYALDQAGRSGLQAPYVDRRIYTAWSSALAASYFFAAAALDRPQLAEFARKTIDRHLQELRTPDGAMYHNLSLAGLPLGTGLLDDQVSMGEGLLAAYSYTGVRSYLLAARELADWLAAHLYDAAGGGFYDRIDDEPLGRLRYRLKPLAENARAADFLLRLYHLSGDERYSALALGSLRAFSEEYQSLGFFAAGYATAVEHALSYPTHVVVVGPPQAAATRALTLAALGSYHPWLLVQTLDPADAADAELIAQGGYPASEVPQAYLCVGQTCSAPIAEAVALREALAKK